MPEAVARDKTATAQLQAGAPGGECQVKIGGDWRLNERVPSWNSVLQNPHFDSTNDGGLERRPPF